MKRRIIVLPALIATALLTGCSDTPKRDPEPSPVDAAVRTVLINDAKELARNLHAYQAAEGVYPQVSADDVQVATQTILTPPVTVEIYEATPDSASFCLVNPDADAWVSMNTTTNILLTEGETCQQSGTQ